MSRWWRAYDDALHDPKVQSLPPRLFKAWFNILCVASKYDGRLPDMDTLKRLLGVRLDYTWLLVKELVRRGLIDELDGRFEPHNWRKFQYKSDNSTPRVKRFRTVSETPPEYRVQSTEKDISIKKDGWAWPKDFRDQFWNAYPRKVGKGSAIRKLEAIRSSGEIEFNRLLTAIGHIEASDPKFIPHPTTWLNQGRYLD